MDLTPNDFTEVANTTLRTQARERLSAFQKAMTQIMMMVAKEVTEEQECDLSTAVSLVMTGALDTVAAMDITIQRAARASEAADPALWWKPTVDAVYEAAVARNAPGDAKDDANAQPAVEEAPVKRGKFAPQRGSDRTLDAEEVAAVMAGAAESSGFGGQESEQIQPLMARSDNRAIYEASIAVFIDAANARTKELVKAGYEDSLIFSITINSLMETAAFALLTVGEPDIEDAERHKDILRQWGALSTTALRNALMRAKMQRQAKAAEADPGSATANPTTVH